MICNIFFTVFSPMQKFFVWPLVTSTRYSVETRLTLTGFGGVRKDAQGQRGAKLWRAWANEGSAGRKKENNIYQMATAQNNWGRSSRDRRHLYAEVGRFLEEPDKRLSPQRVFTPLLLVWLWDSNFKGALNTSQLSIWARDVVCI